MLFNEGLKNVDKTFKESQGNISSYQKLMESLLKESAIDGTLFDPKKEKKIKVLPTKEDLELERALLITNIKQSILDYNYSSVFNQGKNNIQKSLLGKEPLIPIENIFGQDLPAYVSKELEKVRVNLNDFKDDLAKIFEGGVESGLGNIGEAIGSALQTGDSVLQAGGAAILGTIGNVAIQVGKLAIGVGVSIEAIKKSLKTLNPVVAIAAGVALVALGAFAKSAASSIGSSNSSSGTAKSRPKGFASGVTNFEGGLAYVHAGELLTNLPTGANVVPRAKTDRLLGNIGGGAGSWEVAGVLRGQDIDLAVRRTQKNNSTI